MEKPTYQIIPEQHSSIIKRTDPSGTVWWIPMDAANSDYQEYLSSLEGKEPNLPEVEETPETPEAE
jgi:hypothetical protein